MNSRNWFVTFSVSLYVLFFAFAFWSALPASVTGNVAGTSSMVEPLIATCGLESTAAVQGPFSLKEETEQFTGETYIGWLSPGYETVYHCALQAGAMFN